MGKDVVTKWQDKTAPLRMMMPAFIPLRMMGTVPTLLSIGDELVDEINALGAQVEELQQELRKWDPGMEF